MKDVVIEKTGYVYAIITINFDDGIVFDVNIYNEPFFCSECCDKWRYFDDRRDKIWIYDFSYRPSLSEIVDVLLSKLNSLGLR